MSRSCPKAVSTAALDRLEALLGQAESVAGGLSAGQLLEAIGRAARLDAVLHARYEALEASTSAALPTPPPDSPRYLDAAGAAAYLGISKSTVLRLAKKGTLRARRPSEGIVRFDRADLEAYMVTA